MYKQVLLCSMILASTNSVAQSNQQCDVTWTGSSSSEQIVISASGQISILGGTFTSDNKSTKLDPRVRNCINLGSDNDAISIYSEHLNGVVIHAGQGNDTILVRSGNNVIYGEDGNDYITGGKGRDYIFGGADNDFLAGNEEWDVIMGGEGDDRIKAGSGVDVIHGGEGDDLIRTYDELAGCEEINVESVHGSPGNDIVYSCRHDKNDEGTNYWEYFTLDDPI